LSRIASKKLFHQVQILVIREFEIPNFFSVRSAIQEGIAMERSSTLSPVKNQKPSVLGYFGKFSDMKTVSAKLNNPLSAVCIFNLSVSPFNRSIYDPNISTSISVSRKTEE
jgi:hypothetical protein